MRAQTPSLNDFYDYLNAHENKGLLRFITCGSVDDGKSTLIGRLLYESQLLYDDQLATLAEDSKKFGTTQGELDFALLVDGLASEREQGITIDVAHRFFSTDKRKFIVADTPGHEQYTRNMATGASLADLAIVMVDARHGILTQTRRHGIIVSMLGVKHIILAINKMDLVSYEQAVFDNIRNTYETFAKDIDVLHLQAIPVSALMGDNIIAPSSNMPWYQGPTLLEYLETINFSSPRKEKPFRMFVQWVNRPNLNFRGFCGRISSGTLRPGDAIKILPTGKTSTVKEIITYDDSLQEAHAGHSITLTLNDELDVSRGDVFSSAINPCEIASQFEVKLLWLSEKPMVSGRQYVLKIGSQTAYCTPSAPKYRIDVNTMEHLATKSLSLNEIGCCHIATDRGIVYEPYASSRELGGFILIDRMTHETVAAGFIQFALRRSTNIHAQELVVSQSMRAVIKQQAPVVLWFTGLSGAGKSTIANLVEKELNACGKHTMLLDGDNIRHGLNQNLGFTEADRAENIRRIAEVAKLMTNAGLITLVAFISPYRAERAMAKALIGEAQFIEIFVDAPLFVVEARDVKGLYKKAKRGEIKNLTGIGSRYEPPESPALRLDTVSLTAENAAKKVLNFIEQQQSAMLVSSGGLYEYSE